jgi:hypothetical protein
MQNRWRIAHHLPPLAEPAARAVSPVPSEPLNAAIDRAIAAGSEQNASSIAEIEKMGIGALAGVNSRLVLCHI